MPRRGPQDRHLPSEGSVSSGEIRVAGIIAGTGESPISRRTGSSSMPRGFCRPKVFLSAQNRSASCVALCQGVGCELHSIASGYRIASHWSDRPIRPVQTGVPRKQSFAAHHLISPKLGDNSFPGQQEERLQAVIISGFVGPADFILQPMNNGFRGTNS